MKDFFKNVLATIVGILISTFVIGGIVTLLFFGIIGVLLSNSSDTFVVKDKTILGINLTGVMKDRVIENPFMEYLGISEAEEISLTDILAAIEEAKNNDKVSGIYIRSGYFSASSASLNEIREKLEDFKSSDKFIVAYADTYLQGGYFLSTVADKVIMNPEGSLDLHGFAAGPTFYKGLLDKIGVEMQIFKVGTYKSAVEPYMLDKMSEANKEQVSSYINDIWSSLLGKISVSRDISVERLNQLTDSLPLLRGGEYALKNGLVDDLMYETEAKKYLKSLVDMGEDDKLNIALASDIVKTISTVNIKVKDEIAVLYAEGNIVSGSSNTDINDRYLIKQIEKLHTDDNIKGVVFRVNSPGGSAYASEQIWKAISDLKEQKPVVVSMGDYAASGGYYIACNASKIYAQPNTLTGSIGIFGVFPNVQGLTNKIGLTFDQVKTNKMSDFGDISRPMNADEKVILQSYIEKGYDLFLTRCAEGRGKSKEEINEIAQGRVWTGRQALELGLVDALGGLEDAINEVAELTDILDYNIKEYPRMVTPIEAFFQTQKDDIAARFIKEYIGEDFQILKTVKEIKNLKEQDFIQARIPFELEIK